MKSPLAIIFLLCSSFCFGQNYVRSNEDVILSFQTNAGKQVYLVKDRNNKYISYRFGSKERIEFEYPGSQADSWGKFTYSYFLRGGGAANEGMDLNYLYFNNKNFRYVIYHTYHAVGNRSSIGIRVIDIESNKTVDINGKTRTRVGSLVDFRDNGLVAIGEELFD